jgi:hypothetical protein
MDMQNSRFEGWYLRCEFVTVSSPEASAEASGRLQVRSASRVGDIE